MPQLKPMPTSAAEAPSLFIALSTERIMDEQSIQCLTPYIMQWDEHTWIFDLRSCLRYWHRCAAESQSSLNALIRLSLIRLCRDDGFRAVICPHPWQGVLALAVMEERDLEGLIDLNETLGRNIFRQLSWNQWWPAITTLAGHLQAAPETAPSFRAERFRSQSHRMRQSCERMNFQSPHFLSRLEPSALTRRFGTLLGRFLNIALSPQPPSHDCFPWLPHRFADGAEVTRHLDFPLSDWEQLPPFLAEDFESLCKHSELNESAHILKLNWHITLSDLSERCVPIIFRHPHSLHNERGSHKTALLQSQFAFAAHVKCDEHDPQYLLGINSWRLEVDEQIFLQNHSVGLFGDTDAAPDAMLKLENQLPVALEQFDLQTHWQPEFSFANNKESRAGLFLESSLSALKATAKERPLFLLTKPTILNRQGQSSLWRFLERTMTEWWQTSSPKQILRDYYQYVDQNGRCYWVYKDTMERWYVHGIFA